jgi:F-type H+-transporting ATPase subunit b
VQLDWTTFLLEIVNFLVLVWILKRFLYRPVLDMIARRQASIEQTLGEARDTEARAEALKSNYEKRLEEWEHEREVARAKLHEELAAERQRRLTQLEEVLAAERERQRTLEDRRAEEFRRSTEAQALELGAAFSTRLLGRLAGVELDTRLVDIAIEDLAALPAEQRLALQAAAKEPGASLQLSFAHPVSESEQRHLTDAMEQALDASLPLSVEIVPELLAGVRITLGPWILKANLHDELSFFRMGAQRG